ncbi:MAG: sigma-70 family RNA polymerase sigma factor [Oscillospiraceae bacterium]|nr:sigma-70 family RNA polymerase sigma factor [Oscillospiraceae bacterium]
MDEQELTRLVEKFNGTVYRAAYCCLHNSADADDITQDTFLALYTSGVEFTGDEHIKAWLLRVALNRCRNVLRSLRYRTTVPLEEVGELSAQPERHDSLLPVIMKLKPKHRIVLYMFYYEDIPIRRIAEILGEKTTTVTSRLSRARHKLKQLMIKEGYDEY